MGSEGSRIESGDVERQWELFFPVPLYRIVTFTDDYLKLGGLGVEHAKFIDPLPNGIALSTARTKLSFSLEFDITMSVPPHTGQNVVSQFS